MTTFRRQSPQCGTKRKAAEVGESDQDTDLEDDLKSSRGRTDTNFCNACADPQFVAMIRSGRPCEMSRELELIWQNKACSCCRLIRQALRQRYEPDWINEASNRRGWLCEMHLMQREPQLHLQRNDLAKSVDVILVCLTSKDSYPQWRSPRDQGSVGLETNSSQTLRSGHTRSKYAMIRRPIEPCLKYDMLKSWIHECDTDHMKLHSPPQDDLIKLASQGRFRLIDVLSSEVVCKYDLECYCALSYVWSASMTTSSRRQYDEAAHRKPDSKRELRCEWDQLPKTIRDAIHAVREIGQRYLWVDYLCIDQYDPEDKAENIAAMSSIYKSAYLTLIAADGKDADSGLTRVRANRKAEVPLALPGNGTEQSICLLPGRLPLENMLEQSAWNTRAWTLQEHILSTRCLVFTPDEVILDCSHRVYREAYDLLLNPAYRDDTSAGEKPIKTHNGKSLTMHAKALSRKKLELEDYFEFLKAYTTRELTYPGDRLDAFSAMLRKFEGRKSGPDQRYAESGIPLAFMYFAMTWSVDTQRHELPTTTRAIHTGSHGTRTFPTWSWTAWPGYRMTEPELPGLYKWQWKQWGSGLTFTLKDKYNIIALPQSTSSKWPLLTQDDITLCKPEPGGPVTIHMMARLAEVRIEVPEMGLHAPDRMIEVAIRGVQSGTELGSAFVHPKHIWDEDHNFGFELLRWGENTKIELGEATILLRKLDGANVYNRVSPDVRYLGLKKEQAFDAHSRTKYIKLR